MTKPTKWPVCLVKTQISLGIAQSDLIRVFAVLMKKHWALNDLFSAQWRHWSDRADAQTHLSLRWAHHFIGFVVRPLRCLWFVERIPLLLLFKRTIWILFFWHSSKYEHRGSHRRLTLHSSGIWARSCENVSYAIWEQQRCRSKMGQVMRKCVLCHMRTTKVQISLRIRTVWSAPLLFAA